MILSNPSPYGSIFSDTRTMENRTTGVALGPEDEPFSGISAVPSQSASSFACCLDGYAGRKQSSSLPQWLDPRSGPVPEWKDRRPEFEPTQLRQSRDAMGDIAMIPMKNRLTETAGRKGHETTGDKSDLAGSSSDDRRCSKCYSGRRLAFLGGCVNEPFFGGIDAP